MKSGVLIDDHDEKDDENNDDDETLGLYVLDEPSATQSDPTLVHLKLKTISR